MLKWRCGEAARRRCPLEAVIVWAPGGDPAETQWLSEFQTVAELRNTIRRDLAQRVEAVFTRTGEKDVEITVDAHYGHPVETLINNTGPNQLLVMGSRGLGAIQGLLLGSVSQEVAQYGRSPVVVVPGGSDAVAGRVVVGVDGSPSSLAALRFAADTPCYDVPGCRSCTPGGTRRCAATTAGRYLRSNPRWKKRGQHCVRVCETAWPEYADPQWTAD